MEQTPRRRLIGVLGGMGPAATIDFMAKVLAATPARTDQEHVPLIVHAVPQIPDRSAAITAGSDAPFPPLLAGLRVLERGGAECVAMPCNTAHHWHARLARSSAVPVLHIADAVAEVLVAAGAGSMRVALMATRGTLAAGIYRERLAGVVGRLVVPPEPTQALIDGAIAAVKRGDAACAREGAHEAGRRLAGEGAELLLLACTELPIALGDGPPAVPAIDATEALAHACVRASLAA